MKEKLPCASGIYQIRCTPTGIIYVGSAVSLRYRWNDHRRHLQRGNHHNFYLQTAWNSYGETNFEFSILELVDVPNLLRAEQEWIDRTECTKRNIGFNISNTSSHPGGINIQVWEGFIDPQGNEIIITNLQEFCRQHNLDFPSMHRLSKGKSKLKSHKGWTHKNSVRQREYVKTYDGFIAPDGRAAGAITNLAAFCREQGLDKTHMVAVMRGRIYSHRGWTYANGREYLGGPKTYMGYINPEGQQVIIKNLQAFCEENGLHPVHMHELKSGKRKAYRGWIWREPDEQSGA